MCDSLWPHGLQHARLPCPPSPGACSNSCTLSQWCYLTISSHFSSCPQSFPAPGLFQWVCFQYLVAKVLELQFQHQSFQWIFKVDFLLELTGLIFLQSKGLSRIFSSSTVESINSWALRLLYNPTLTSVCDCLENREQDWSPLNVSGMLIIFHAENDQGPRDSGKKLTFTLNVWRI